MTLPTVYGWSLLRIEQDATHKVRQIPGVPTVDPMRTSPRSAAKLRCFRYLSTQALPISDT